MGVRAVAPASLTTVFVPRADEAEGSLGVSFALADGVTVTSSQSSTTTVTVAGEQTDFEPVENVLEELGVTATVEIETDVPIGRGFGASGAATLATALSVWRLYDLDASRDGIVRAAHRAELRAGTGQGDVFVQERGGLVFNTGDGIGHRSRSDPIEYTSVGPISTPDLLEDEDALDRIGAAGRTALDRFRPDVELEDWFSVAWEFTIRSGLQTGRVTETVRSVESAGGSATMAMVGETVVASGVEGVLDTRTRLSDSGARLL
ncbi:MAG: GHMP kinase [Halodesulfurarchaeum sp.]